MLGSVFSYLSDTVEKISGLNDEINDNMLESIEACRKFYVLKA